ncbi:helix-turn-helix domain-containing protein [Marinobacter sp. JSM 1782161]|uniref:helix-turn-helix domain-containing protein n=1 Tax=Marinobacter sp. JSM 1782161 TaxID=2685906 RepID=UPI0014040FE0|nr:helix-turn-helix transcriptional regulator [Marinobacter sp. JSM 1782161]
MTDEVRTKSTVITALKDQIASMQKLVDDLEHSTTPDLRQIGHLPELLRERREQLKLSPVETAELAGLSPNTYRTLERADGNPRLETLESVGQVLNFRLWIEMV